ncbi:MAG TPA: hypothetical protein VKU80_16060 [Planctomycetota bacterium]|nr:hypothetical protein [Planctomycetota bacterium]
MSLLGTWADTQYVPPGHEGSGAKPITARHFLCDACQIPLRVEYCPVHQKRLIVPPVIPPAGLDLPRQRRPHRCTELGCTYEKSRDEAPLPVG